MDLCNSTTYPFVQLGVPIEHKCNIPFMVIYLIFITEIVLRLAVTYQYSPKINENVNKILHRNVCPNKHAISINTFNSIV